MLAGGELFSLTLTQEHSVTATNRAPPTIKPEEANDVEDCLKGLVFITLITLENLYGHHGVFTPPEALDEGLGDEAFKEGLIQSRSALGNRK